jgi:hypothetical protein
MTYCDAATTVYIDGHAFYLALPRQTPGTAVGSPCTDERTDPLGCQRSPVPAPHRPACRGGRQQMAGLPGG